jgi:acyl-CoA dehydrogenase
MFQEPAMNFDFAPEQKEIADSARRFLARHCSRELVRAIYDGDVGRSHELWSAMADLGMMATAIAEPDGGIDAGYLALCALAEELGRVLAPVPFSSSIYMFAEILKSCSSRELRRDYLAQVASGALIGTLAEYDDHAAPVTLREGQLYGRKLIVPDGAIAGFAVVTACFHRDTALLLVDLSAPGVIREPLESLDPSRPQTSIYFDGASGELLASGSEAYRILEHVRNCTAVLLGFEQLGGAEKSLEMACEHVKQRMVFGRSLGSFQAIKHLLAEMYVATTLARSNCYFGAWALASNTGSLSRAAATVRLSATHAFELCAAGNIHVHGAMGFTWESDCHLYYRRSNHLARQLGPVSSWEDQLIEAINAA